MGAAGAFMGGLGQLMGGNSKSNSNTSSDSSQNSSNAQASRSRSNNQSSQVSGSGNQSYGSIEQAMSPTLGYTASAGNMLGALLGLPSNQFYNNTPSPSVMPTAPSVPSAGGGGRGGNQNDMITQLFNHYMKTQGTTTPTPTTPTTSVPPHVGTTIPISGAGTSSSGTRDLGVVPRMLDRREHGGPVAPGQPVVVGEKRPEVFVPHTAGQILPQVPTGQTPPIMAPGMLPTMLGHNPKVPGGHGGHGGVLPPPVMPPVGTTPPPAPVAPPAWTPSTPANPQSALDTWANSAGMNFLRDQGTQAIANTGAGSGTFQSGATGKALEKFGMGLGSTYQNDYINHLLDFAKLGLGGASAMSGAGGVSQGVGSSSGGSDSTSFGSGTSTGTSSLDTTSKSKSKQGLGI